MKKIREIEWKPVDWNQSDEPQASHDDESSDFEDREPRPMGGIIKLENVINTPFGLVKYNNPVSPLKDTDFFVGCCNFTIDNDVANKIEQTEGVEILRIMSRYRFIIGICPLFQSHLVIDDIEKVLNVLPPELPLSPAQEEQFNNVLKKIYNDSKQAGEFWSAYVFPNGNFTMKPGSSKEDRDKNIENLNDLKSLSNGRVLPKEDISGE